MPGISRKAYLIELAEEYIEAGVGRHDWHAIVEKMLEDGHITESELARDYGISGFQREIIRKAQKARDAAGREKYVKTKTGGIVQMRFADLDDVSRTYWERKHHIRASEERLAVLRQQIIDEHGVDPEALPDPFEHNEDQLPPAA